MPESMTTWTPDIPVPAEPDGWHPEDCLFAPLNAPSGELVGILSVDLPSDGRRPGLVQREMLELFAQHAAIAVQHARLHHDLEESRAQLHHAATHDPLTGLANRALLRAFTDELSGRPGAEIGVLVIDLDDFKAVNDRGGHDAGDEVLCSVARRMTHLVGPGDLVARTGGDEFVVVLTGADCGSTLDETADRIRLALSAPIETRAGVRQVGASVGHAVGGGDFASLAAAADADMYRTKQRRRKMRSRVA